MLFNTNQNQWGDVQRCAGQITAARRCLSANGTERDRRRPADVRWRLGKAEGRMKSEETEIKGKEVWDSAGWTDYE